MQRKSSLNAVPKGTRVRLFSHYNPVYYWNRDSKYFVNVNQGGTSSSKTYSIMQLLAKYGIEKPGSTITVASQDFPNLMAGPIKDFKTLIRDSELLYASLENPKGLKGPFRFKNGSLLEFKSYESWQDAKSGKRTFLFINEAQGVDPAVADELMIRTTDQVFIDYNPNAKFWVHYDTLKRDDATLFISNFVHNKYCNENTIKMLMHYKHMWESTGLKKWENKWKVYGLGLTGVVEGTIFEHVNYVPFLPTHLNREGYGLDFGFQNNYTALIKAGFQGNKLYGKQLIYKQKLTTPALGRYMRAIGIKNTDRIIADSANSEAIAILQGMGFNILPAKKGNGSVTQGIDSILEYDLHLTYDSTDWMVEQENYKYVQKDGIFTNDPIKKFDNCWAALRYYMEDAVGFRTRKVMQENYVPYERKIRLM